MWFNTPPLNPDWSAATKHLSRVDPILKKLIKQIGPCTLHPRKDYFVALCQSIYSQQISTKVASTLFGRFRDQFPKRRPTPIAVAEFLSKGDPALIKHCGLSRQKHAYILDLAHHFVNEKISTKKLARMTDEEVIEDLTKVKGIGRWTAEMFLIFVLNRPDLLPIDDLGFRQGLQRAYSLDHEPKGKELIDLAEKWKPFRSIATWYFYRTPGKKIED